MANRRIPMRKIREILRLSELSLSQHQISRALNVSRPVIKDYQVKLAKVGLSYAQIERLSDSELTALFYTNQPLARRREELHALFPRITEELRRPGVTLHLLWQEYMGECDGLHYSYSRFCRHYNSWRKENQISMRIEHKAGDRAFIDFAGKKPAIVNAVTGELTEVEMFVAVLGGSQLTYCEAVMTQQKEDFIRASENALHFFGGAPNALVVDNLKSGVTRACRYEPDVNPEYADFASHYGTVVLPTRSRKPKDKSLVEGAVKLVYQRIYAPMRDEIFHTLADLNRRIWELLTEHNNAEMQKLQTSRRELFEKTERSQLKPLPDKRYPLNRFSTATVGFDYHVYLKEDKHYYSVPFRLRGREIRFIYSDSAVEIFHDHQRVVFYKREKKPGQTTKREHMPSTHGFVADWNPTRIARWAEEIGPHVEKLCVEIMKARDYPEQGFKSSIGVISLAKKYGNERTDRACKRALAFSNYSYRAVGNILKGNLDKLEDEPTLFKSLPEHTNVRGSKYYTGEKNDS